MTIAIKKFGDPHIYTVLSFDDYEDDPYYCCVKYDPEYGDHTHPNRVCFSDNDWERVDRHEVEHYSRFWVNLSTLTPESRTMYHPDLTDADLTDLDLSFRSDKMILLTTALKEKGGLSILFLKAMKKEMVAVFNMQCHPHERDAIDKVAESYTQLDFTDIHDVWTRTKFIQPFVLVKHLSIINKLIQDYTG